MAKFTFYSTNISIPCVPSENCLYFFKIPDTLTSFYSDQDPLLCTESSFSKYFLSTQQALYQATQGDKIHEAWLLASRYSNQHRGPVELGLGPLSLTKSIQDSPWLWPNWDSLFSSSVLLLV